jgi:hypothetical protein
MLSTIAVPVFAYTNNVAPAYNSLPAGVPEVQN